MDVPSAPGHSQKRELSPGWAECQSKVCHKLKYVKPVSCVTQLSCVQPVKTAQNVVNDQPVGPGYKSFGKLGWIWGPVRK